MSIILIHVFIYQNSLFATYDFFSQIKEYYLLNGRYYLLIDGNDGRKQYNYLYFRLYKYNKARINSFWSQDRNIFIVIGVDSHEKKCNCDEQVENHRTTPNERQGKLNKNIQEMI